MKNQIKVLSVALGLLAVSFAVNAQNKANTAPAKSETTKPVPAPASAAPAPATAASATPASDADFKFEAMEYNYGTIKQGEVVNHEFKFTNTGKDPLIISNAAGSCGCTVPDWPHQPIKKGEQAVIKVTFNSAGKSGMQDKTVTINSNSKNSPHVLHIKGTVDVPPAPATPAPAAPAPAEKK